MTTPEQDRGPPGLTPAPCPFCGNHDLRLECTITEFVLGCRACRFALTEKFSNDNQNELREQKLIDRWNQRADEALIGELVEALQSAADQFSYYVKLHNSKSPPDEAKALANGAMANMCRAAIQKARAP